MRTQALLFLVLMGSGLFAQVTQTSLIPVNDSRFAPTPMAWPNETFAAVRDSVGVCSNSTQFLKLWDGTGNSPKLLDSAGSGELILTSGKYPQSLLAGLACQQTIGYYLATSSSGKAGAYVVALPGGGVSKSVEEGQVIKDPNGIPLGTIDSIFGLDFQQPLAVLGAYYRPADDPNTLYQGIFAVRVFTGVVEQLIYRSKATDKQFVLGGRSNRYTWIWDLTNHEVQRIQSYTDDQGNNHLDSPQTVFTGVVSARVLATTGEAVVGYTNGQGFQLSRFANTPIGTPDAENKVVVNGKFNGQAIGNVVDFSAYANGPLYLLTQSGSSPKSLVKILGSQMTKLISEDQNPTGVYTRVLAAGDGPYLAQRLPSGTSTAYKVVETAVSAHITNIVNAASYADLTGLSRNTWITIFGGAMALSTERATSVPLPDNLASTRVLIRVPGGQISAPLLYASPTQINFLMPDLGSNVTSTSVAVLLTNGQITQEVPLNIVPSNPGIFQANGVPIVTEPSGRVLAPGEPLQDGAVYVTYWNGLGPTNPMVLVNQLVPLDLFALSQPVRLKIGGGEAEVLFAGLTPQSVGLYQINFKHHLLSRGGDPYSAQGTLTLSDGNAATFAVTVR